VCMSGVILQLIEMVVWKCFNNFMLNEIIYIIKVSPQDRGSAVACEYNGSE